MSESETKWIPLESNPIVMNQLLKYYGVNNNWGFIDIISFDEEYLSSISTSILAVLLLFPYTQNYKQFHKDQNVTDEEKQNVDPQVYFMRQTIRNSCGTIAMIHAIANNMDSLYFDDRSVIRHFIKKTTSLDAEEKAKELEDNIELRNAHEACALLGNSEVSNLDSTDSQDEKNSAPISKDEVTDNHYIALVNVNSKLYELDGYKVIPMLHGNTSKESFLSDAGRVCLEYMKREPKNINFTALAFGAL